MARSRPRGEAWNRPFVAVYEPYGAGLGSFITRARRMKDAPEAGDFVGVAVEHNPRDKDTIGRVDYVLNATDSRSLHRCEGISFRGNFAVVSSNADGFLSIYLGAGDTVVMGNHGIQSRPRLAEAVVDDDGEPPDSVKALLVRKEPA